MADYSYEDLDKLLVQVRRVEEHREKGAEKNIRKAYQELLQGVNHSVADTYSRLAENDKLTYGILQKHGYYARFLEEVEKKVNDITPEIKHLIRDTVEKTYTATYDGLVEAVKKTAAGKMDVTGLKGCTPEVMRKAVENPISKLTLDDRLEKHRKEIVYDIKKNISIGLMNGDGYATMANRIKQSVNGDYKKAVRITRTETHRVRQAGEWESSMETDKALQSSSSGMRIQKTWKTMKDERVRPASRYKTQKGWKNGKPGKYDHKSMEGVSCWVDEKFKLPSGATTQYPGGSGVAGEDINCRCYLSYHLQKVENNDRMKKRAVKSEKEFAEVTKEMKDGSSETIEEAENYVRDVLGISNVSYKGVDIVTANEWNQGLTDVLKQFPELKEVFGFVGECHERNKLLKPVVEQKYLKFYRKKYPFLSEEKLKEYADKDVIAFMQQMFVDERTFAQSWVPSELEFIPFRGITVNGDWGRDSKVFLQALKEQVISKFHPEGCTTIRYVLDHEVGHQLDELLNISALPKIRQLFDSRSQIQITADLSRYAWENDSLDKYSEMIAEAWAEYCNNSTPREIAKTVGETILSEYKKYEEWVEEARRMGWRE